MASYGQMTSLSAKLVSGLLLKVCPVYSDFQLFPKRLPLYATPVDDIMSGSLDLEQGEELLYFNIFFVKLKSNATLLLSCLWLPKCNIIFFPCERILIPQCSCWEHLFHFNSVPTNFKRASALLTHWRTEADENLDSDQNAKVIESIAGIGLKTD